MGRGDDDDVIQFAVKCLESAAKALQGVGSELVAGFIDLGPVSGAKTASYLLLEATSSGPMRQGQRSESIYSARAETVRARVPFRRHRRDYAHAIDATASVTHRTTKNGRPCLASSRTSRPGTARRDCSRACARRAVPLLVGRRCSPAALLGASRCLGITKAGVVTPRVGVSDARPDS